MSESTPKEDLVALLDVASVAFTTLSELFIQVTHALSEDCAINGRLDGKKVDQHQLACYELALACADLLAMKTVLSNKHESELEQRLALTYVVEAIQATMNRLDTLFLQLDLDLEPLLALEETFEWRSLRKAVKSSAALERTGALVAQGNIEIGRVTLSEELILAQDAFRRMGYELVAPQAEAIHRHDLTVPETLLQPLREMGVFGLSIPERFGGTRSDENEDNLMMIVVTEALSEASLAAAGSLITRPEILSRALLEGGTVEQQNHWLPQIAAGQPLCAIAITEPDFGSDVASLSLRATRRAGGWLLNGAKTWCTFAGKAGLLMVVARTDPDRSAGHRGLSLFLVEKPSSEAHEFNHVQNGGGRLTGKAIPTIGYRGMHSFDLAFEDFFVPEENLIGGAAGLGKGFYFTMAGMMGGRMQTAARACGVMRAALSAAVRYAGDRKVFAAPLLSYPLTLAKIATMAARFSACRQSTYLVGSLMDQGRGRMEASLVKLLACRSAELITREAQQIHGAMGYAEETAVSRYFVDARVLSIFEGAEETLALKVVARSLLEEALSSQAGA